MAKNLKYLFIHCTATPEGRNITAQAVKNWHMLPAPRGRGWSRPGYSDLILLDGTLENMREYDLDGLVDHSEMTWGVKGQNRHSRHICYVGGTDKNFDPKDTRTDEQKKTLETYVKYQVLRHPDIEICGHYHFANKACPSFDVELWLESIGIPEKNIYRKSK